MGVVPMVDAAVAAVAEVVVVCRIGPSAAGHLPGALHVELGALQTGDPA